MKATIGAFWSAFAGEHARRVFCVLLEREDARGERERARQVGRTQKSQLLRPSLCAWQRDARDGGAGQRREVIVDGLRLPAHAMRLRGRVVARDALGPLDEGLARRVVEL